MKKVAALIVLLLSCSIFLSMAQTRRLVMHIRFDQTIPNDLEVVPAILKYDKEFAFSFTFDDGLSDAYNLGYKLLKGGSIAADGITYPGFFSTDGCGNRFPFRAGIAWYTANQLGNDLHKDNPGYINYTQALELYRSGWDFFNHSYDHSANTGSVDYLWQINSNKLAFKTNTGIDLNYCVPPSGDEGYLAPALTTGNIACFTSSYGYIGSGFGTNVTVPVESLNPVFWRHIVNSDNFTPAILKQNFDNWVSTTGQGKQKWWNEFTHRVSYTHTGSSLEFPHFREYFDHMELKYGGRGQDNGWFASSSEVYEYLRVRDNLIIYLQKNGAVLDIYLDYSRVPLNFRYYDISLLVKGSGNIQSVTYDSPGKISHSETADGHLINIDVPDSQFAGIENSVLETSSLLKGYPNPVAGKFYLQIPEGIQAVEVSVANMLAEVMPNPPIILNNGLIQMDFTSEKYPPGLYYIRITSKGRYVGFAKVIIDL